MLNKNLYFILLISIFLLKCQKKSNEVFRDYESNINYAEMLIIDKEFKNALIYYEKGFITNNYSVGIDCYNAMICAVHLNNFEKFKYWAYKLANKGVNIDFFKSSVFDKFKDNSGWKGFVKDFNNKNKIFLNNYDEKLKKSLQFLIDKDQKQYCELRYGSNSDLLENAFNETLQIDIEVKKLIDEYGDFTEEKIGLNIINDTVLLRVPIFFPLSRHNFQVEGESFFNDFLVSMNKKGLIKSDLIDLVNHTPFSSNIFLIDNKFYIDKTIQKDKKFVERNIRKIKFQKKNENLKFLIFAQFSQLDFKIDEGENLGLSNLILIDI